VSRPRRPAIVDIGSNSTRLLVVDRLGPDGAEGVRTTTITSLRKGAAPDGRLADDAVERLDEALAPIAERIRDAGADAVVPLATSAVRDAPDRDRVLDLVERRLGARPVVLSGREEAELAFRGARVAAGPGEVTVVDIGGGSTELVCGEDRPRDAVSLQLGAVRSTESHLPEDPPGAEAIARLARDLDAELGSAAARIGAGGEVVGVAGTFTTLAAVDLGGYDPVRVHGHRLGADRLDEIVGRLGTLDLAARRAVPGLHPGRAPFIVAGGEIARAALRACGARSVIVSERDILDGAAAAVVEGALAAAD
jgi:exopolyphosphatase/guanosine-5'-triphosphate,3'-diphosphate pyrophosphatase